MFQLDKVLPFIYSEQVVVNVGELSLHYHDTYYQIQPFIRKPVNKTSRCNSKI